MRSKVQSLHTVIGIAFFVVVIECFQHSFKSNTIESIVDYYLCYSIDCIANRFHFAFLSHKRANIVNVFSSKRILTL